MKFLWFLLYKWYALPDLVSGEVSNDFGMVGLILKLLLIGPVALFVFTLNLDPYVLFRL